MVKSVFILIGLGFIVGCSSTVTNLSHYKQIDKSVIVRDFDSAIVKLNESESYTKKDKVLYYLDLGMLYHYGGYYELSNLNLLKAEKEIDFLYTKSISKDALSFMLNDNALAYSGEDYEDFYINLFKAFNYLKLEQIDDAFVEINMLNHKLSVLEQKNKKIDQAYNKSKDKKIKVVLKGNKFYNDALGRYISMTLYKYLHKFDDANIDFQKIISAFLKQGEIYDFPMPKIEKPKYSSQSSTSFICFTGLSPIKTAKTLYVHTENNLAIIAASQTMDEGENKLTYLDTYAWPGLESGYHFKFQLPYLKKRKSNVDKVRVVVKDSSGLVVGKYKMQLLEDFSSVMSSVFDLQSERTKIKTITRAIVKGIAVKKAKQKAKEQLGSSLLLTLGGYALDIAVDATENADLRLARYLPSKGYILDIFLDQGSYDFEIEYLDSSGEPLYIDRMDRKYISKNNLNLYQSFCLK